MPLSKDLLIDQSRVNLRHARKQVTHICGTFNLVSGQDYFESFSVLVSKWSVNPQLIVEQIETCEN